MNWNPFSNKAAEAAALAETIRADAALERADALAIQVEKLLKSQTERDEKEAQEKAEIDAAIAEANKTAKLIEEEEAREQAKKTQATERGEPYINIVSMDMEPSNGANIGAIEMDWNEQFIKMLHQNGYIGTSDEDAVDQWFRDVCKHVVLETYEDEETGNGVTRNELDDGRAEYS